MTDLKQLIQESDTRSGIVEKTQKGFKSLEKKHVVVHITTFHDTVTENYKSVIFYYE